MVAPILLSTLLVLANAAVQDTTVPEEAETAPQSLSVDPLTIMIDTSDAERFASLFTRTDGNPTAEQIQAEYLDPSGRAIEIFTEYRIQNAEHMAERVAANRDVYRDAIERCLPWVYEANPMLRSIFLGYRGLLPEKPLPAVAVVFGANNTGGTADTDMQVIGLEVICRLSPTRADFDAFLRNIFAHETAHTLQLIETPEREANRFLTRVIIEGVADYIAKTVTGTLLKPERNSWAVAHEEIVWREFANDWRVVEANREEGGSLNDIGRAAESRWLNNAGRPPDGWPDELGYWVGTRIAEEYIAHSTDPHAALRELISFEDPLAILEGSGIELPIAE